MPFPAIAQTQKNISLGTSLTAKDGNCWTSPSGDFAFGFQEIVKHGFILAIWFNKIPERTIVWSANGDNLVKKGCKVELTEDGRLMLKDTSTVVPIWTADAAASGVAYAAMLDTGNFVLVNQDSNNLWESFSQPTDTILPTQTINHGSTLFARRTPSNYSRGRFLFTLETGGDLSLHITNIPLDYVNLLYWPPTGTNYNGFEVIFNQSGSIYLTAQNRSIIYMISNNAVSTEDYYQRATLEYNGVFRHHVYPKSIDSNNVKAEHVAWSSLSFMPSNICTSITWYAGPSACGLNSLCKNDEEGPVCLCPHGYSFVDPSDELKGCRQNFVSQSCDEASSEDLFYFQEMKNTDWPLTYYEHFNNVSDDWCKQNCLNDCFCAALVFKEDACWKKGTPFINGRIDPTLSSKALIKVRENSTDARKHDSSTFNRIEPILLSSSAFLNFFLLFITCFLVLRILNYQKANANMLYPVIQGINLKCFTYTELKQATNRFTEELGRGSFSTVFKGVLASDNGKCVAVKRLDTMVGENDLKFRAEVSSIGRTNHRNLVQLVGFCNERQNRILVYEFMSNGSLESFLFGGSRPSWCKRKEIALGTARGLLYLHELCSSQIIHCDIKPQNILLDDSFTARISDFGVAKLLMMDQTRMATKFRGTKGYAAPEWFKSLPITVKADVYSFGILLLEIVCCRKHYEAKIEHEGQMILVDWAYHCSQQSKLHLLFENNEAKDDIEEMEMYLKIAFWCIQDNPAFRPTMKNVTRMLEGNVEVLTPPSPSSLQVQWK
ncbi:G-type lectin S-receptor-like serine/threonine-protein kinase LECRK3 [Pyrus communis]|uniref:G-type lectin S-receptor-like serine/threonine-protein kinase LECRK3 n=1 Tax=Pyrus communis TaxID=23211 RepID=UPI0035C2508D